MDSIKSPDGYSHLCINRRIRLIMIANAFCDSFGFLILILKYFMFSGQERFSQTLYFIFSLLMICKITLYISSKICIEKLSKMQNLSSLFAKFKSITIIMEHLLKIQTYKQLWSIFMIFLQPCIIYPTWMNEHLVILSQLKVYQLVGFFFDMNLLANPIFQRVNGTQNINLRDFCWKIGFNHKYFNYRIIGILIIVVFGLGNIVKDYQTSGLQDIYEVIYFMFVSMSTVGFGDLYTTQLLPRIITIVCVILGVFVSSMLASKILASSGFTLKQRRQNYLIKKLDLDKRANSFIRNLFVEQIEYSAKKEAGLIWDGDELRNQEDCYDLEQEMQTLVREYKELQSTNPIRISFITNTANRQVEKVISLDLVNTYFSNAIKNFHTKVKRREGHRFNKHFLAPPQ